MNSSVNRGKPRQSELDSCGLRLDDKLIGSLVAGLVACRHEVLSEITSWFQPEFLVDPFHRRCYLAIRSLAARGGPPSAELFAREFAAIFKSKAEADHFRGYFKDYADFNLWGKSRAYALGVWQDWMRYTASDEAREAAGDLIDLSQDPADILQRLGAMYSRYAPPGQTRAVDNRSVLHEIADEIEDPDAHQEGGIRTGLTELDKITGPWVAGNLVVVGARTGEGKSTFCGHVAATAMFLEGKVIAFFTIEMSNKELYRRWAAWLSNDELRPGKRFQQAIANIDVAHQDGRLNLFAGARSIATIETEARAYARSHRPALIIVDYIQIVKPTVRTESREQQVADVVRRLKSLAVECGVPVLAACQLNREAVRSGVGMHQARESGSIEQEADKFLLLGAKRDQETNTMMRTVAVPVKFRVEKNRNGPRGDADALLRPAIFKFNNLAANWEGE